jgi:FkbH-like protein
MEEDEDAAVKVAADHLRMICQGLLEGGRRQLFVQNIVCPPGGLFGSLDARLRGTQRRRVEKFNEALLGILDECGGLLVDIAGLAALVGHERWFDARQWHIAKLPFAPEMGPLYADHVMRLVGAVNGSSRKCLVLDLDNTLWGGVVGDEGVHGLVLGQGDALGEAFVTMQQTARLLRQRGIILAVCSKNDESNARAPFREHPDMVLREEDIAVFQANWQDKASNLEAIARALDIGTDSLVFLDDNPAEREQVRQALPEVAVPELTQDASDYAAILLAGGYFETVSFTGDDRARAAQYQANAQRAQLAGAARDMGEYLASLEMVITFTPFDATGRSRIAQLTQRSNQFNLTTRRYDEAAIGTFEQRSDAFTLQVRLADRFGDNGMISVIICVEKEGEWEIDTWLMSCRVLNRRVEQAVLDVLTASARHRGIQRLVGRYIPTEKNGMVRDHYAKLGFQAAGTQDGADLWVLETVSRKPAKPPMTFVLAEGVSIE